MPWLEVSISVPRDCVARMEDALQRIGALAVTLEDDADDPVLEPGPGSTPLWPSVRLRGLFDATVERKPIVDGLQEAAGAEFSAEIHWREVGDQDWSRAWMERFEPMRFGGRLWIVPSGMQIPPAPENVEISLDPGLAFGTGTHPTTALCLEWLDAARLEGCCVVDYGCGSGVLGIAAALLGAEYVVCVDNDPQALLATAENAARNRVCEQVICRAPDAFAEAAADIVLANILAGPLVELAPRLTGCTRAGGSLVLSGLLEDQLAEVATAYERECEVTGTATRDGWSRLVLRKR